MKKYLCVAWDGYYPNGGLANVRFHTDDFNLAEAVAAHLKSRFDESIVVDRDDFEPDTYYVCDFLNTLVSEGELT